MRPAINEYDAMKRQQPTVLFDVLEKPAPKVRGGQ
jgi:hypothetical protein